MGPVRDEGGKPAPKVTIDKADFDGCAANVKSSGIHARPDSQTANPRSLADEPKE